MSFPVEQLRLGVAMAHAVPPALLTIRLARGRDLRCSHDNRLQPDLHPCQARQLLTSAREGGAVDWLNEVVGVELGGPRLVDHQGGLHRAESDDGPRWCFATTLARFDAHDAVEAAMTGLFETRCIPTVEELFSSLELLAHIDHPLGVVVVSCPEQPIASPVSGEEAMRAALAACLVGELCDAAPANRGLR